MPDLPRIFDDLIRFQIELWNAVDARLRDENDVTLARFQVMRFLATAEDARLIDIATDMVITMGGASKLVDRIEAAGHCERRANPADGRSSFIELTAEGHDAYAEATRTFESELEQRFDASPSQLTQLGETLVTLRAAR